MPFDSNKFDIVVSIYILEHVRNIELAISEMLRVLKPGGKLWLRCPNYLYPYEVHYKRNYFPFLPKFLEQIYFNILSRKKSNYFININRITPNSLFKILKKYNIEYQDLSVKKVKQNNFFSKLLHKLYLYREINLLISKRFWIIPSNDLVEIFASELAHELVQEHFIWYNTFIWKIK